MYTHTHTHTHTGIAVEEAAMAEDAGGDGQELVVAGGEVGKDKGEDDEIFEAAEEFNEDDFVDEGDEYAEMEEEEDHVVRPAPAAAAIAALRSVSIDAALLAAGKSQGKIYVYIHMHKHIYIYIYLYVCYKWVLLLPCVTMDAAPKAAS